MPLIPSPRHSEADLVEWARLESFDAVLSQSQALERKEQRAVEVIREFAAGGSGYVGTSWGKDSVVVAHLLSMAKVSLPLVWVHLDEGANPDCPLVRDAYLESHPDADYHEITASRGDRRASERGFAIAAERFGDRHISGVRAQESSERRMTMLRNGVVSARTCRPIGWWSGEDVFAFLYKHALPVHPAYAMSFGGTIERSRLRVGSLGGDRGTGRGRREWERHYYPDVFARS